jgi:AcrR family transcriptional regulator
VAALLDAAAVFAKKGYDAATMTEIAVRANAAIGSLYQFFPSKEALADALLIRYAERVEYALHQIAERAVDLTPASLSDALVGLMLDLASDRAAALGLIDAGSDTADRRTIIRDAMRRQIAAILLTANTRSGWAGSALSSKHGKRSGYISPTSMSLFSQIISRRVPVLRNSLRELRFPHRLMAWQPRS